jgi:hypothetical protein
MVYTESFNADYSALQFAKDTSWDEFIKALWIGPGSG